MEKVGWIYLREYSAGYLNMRKQKTKTWKAVILTVILAVVVVILVKTDFSVKTVLSYTPENPVLAACLLVILYSVKSATVVFPVAVLEIAAGHLFSTGTALIINSVGIGVLLTVPYLIGYHSGIHVIRKIIRKYPAFEEIVETQQENSYFLCFFLRVIGCLPGDIVTMYFGATKTPYLQNLIGGFLGMCPGMILATVLGSGIQDPSSSSFWISVLLTLILSVTSFLVYRLYRRKLHKSNRE